MTNIWHDISPKRIRPNDFIAVIEISKGSKKKYEMDKETGLLILDRILHTSTHYPPTMVIPRTYGDDSDPCSCIMQLSHRAHDPCPVLPHRRDNHEGQRQMDERSLPFPSVTQITTFNNLTDLPAHVFQRCATSSPYTKTLGARKPL